MNNERFYKITITGIIFTWHTINDIGVVYGNSRGGVIMKGGNNLYLYRTSARVEEVNKHIGVATRVYFNILNNSDEYNIDVIVSCPDAEEFTHDKFNYAEIRGTTDAGAWNDITKYYFIKAIRSVGKSRYILSLELDVLMAYRVSILASTQVVSRNENNFSLYYPDNIYKSKAYPLMQCIGGWNGFSETYSYIVNTCTKGGSADGK